MGSSTYVGEHGGLYTIDEVGEIDPTASPVLYTNTIKNRWRNGSVLMGSQG